MSELPPADLPGTPQGVRLLVAAGNEALYHHLALYLQVLRELLPRRVELVCFHLATQVHGPRYLDLPRSRRLALHRRLRQLVARCTMLLTVEQLVSLAGRMAEERQSHGRRPSAGVPHPGQPSEDASRDFAIDALSQAGAPQHEGIDAPPGSIHLNLSLPLSMGGMAWSSSPAGSGRTPQGSALEGGMGGMPPLEPLLPADATDEDPSDDPIEEEEEESDEPKGRSGSAALLQALGLGEEEIAALFRSLSAADSSAPEPSSAAAPPAEASPQASAAASTAPPAPGGGGKAAPAQSATGLWEQGRLPDDPILLLDYLDGLEQALGRRLRNLSHAINVAMLRCGLSAGLLPESLLDAVMQGQIETLSAPANALRLQLPFGMRPGAPPLQAWAILLRPVDLEMEEPRLRTCRRRLQQHRQEIRRMAQHYRRLRRRSQTREAERLWLQDIRSSSAAMD